MEVDAPKQDDAGAGAGGGHPSFTVAMVTPAGANVPLLRQYLRAALPDHQVPQ